MTLESHGATVNPGLEILGLEFFICGQTDLSSPKHISVFSCINNNGKLTKEGGWWGTSTAIYLSSGTGICRCCQDCSRKCHCELHQATDKGSKMLQDKFLDTKKEEVEK